MEQKQPNYIPIQIDQLNNYKGRGPLLMLSEIGVVDPISTTSAGLSSVSVELKGWMTIEKSTMFNILTAHGEMAVGATLFNMWRSLTFGPPKNETTLKPVSGI